MLCIDDTSLSLIPSTSAEVRGGGMGGMVFMDLGFSVHFSLFLGVAPNGWS